MEQSDRSAILLFSALLIFGGILLMAACLVYLLVQQPDNLFFLLLQVPGEFMVRSFHAAAFLIPLFLFMVAGLAIGSEPVRVMFAESTLLFFPFLTTSLTLRLIFDSPNIQSPITIWATDAFTRQGGIFLFLLLTVGGLLGILHLRRRLSLKPADSPAESVETDTTNEATEAHQHHYLPIPIDVTAFDRTQSPEPPAPLEQPATYEQPAPLKQPAAYEPPAPLEQPATYEPPAPLEQPAAYEQPAPIEQPATYEQPAPIEQPAAYEPPAPLEQPAAYEQPAPLKQLDSLEPDEIDAEPSEEVDLFFGSGGFRVMDDAVELSDMPVASPDQITPYRQPAPRQWDGYRLPIDELVNSYERDEHASTDEETQQAGELLRQTLLEFNIEATITGIRRGPVITMYELLPAPGVKLARITNLSDNIALRLAAASVRIVAPIPGKRAVGIEIPNKRRQVVSFGEIVVDYRFDESTMRLPIALGKNIPGDPQIIDLARTPHLLIAGATGAGKSVCVNTLICSLLCRRSPQEVRLLLIDPKIVELKLYNDIPHLLTPVITDSKRALQALRYCVFEMERRYGLLDSIGARDIVSYNGRLRERDLAASPLPYLIVVIDEFADLMVGPAGKEIETTLARLAAMSRAVGIHLTLATQRPSTDVITGIIKANIPSRVAFMVSSKIDSRIIIDAAGAEQLLGQGDMLFTSSWEPFPERVQGALLTEGEVERIAGFLRTLGPPDYIDEEIFSDEQEGEETSINSNDPLMEQATEIVLASGKASASFLQRRLKIGYNRAASLVETMEAQGIVGPAQGSKPREILHR